MNSLFKTCMLLSIILLLGCNANDDDDPNRNDLFSHFKINESSPYLTPNGYYEEYTSLNGEIERIALHFIDGEFLALNANPEPGKSPCSWVENMNQGVRIWMRPGANQELTPGFYSYVNNDSDVGITSNSKVFYGYDPENQCFFTAEENLKITDGTITITKEGDIYAIAYSLVSENGKDVQGIYYGELKKRPVAEL